MSRPKPNQRALTLAHRLEAIIALNITNGVAQLQAELANARTGPAKGESSGRSNNTTSTTERNANEAYRLGLMIEDLRDALDGAEIAIGLLDRLASEACRTRAFAKEPDDEPAQAADVRTCRDNQQGRPGVVPTKDSPGWGRPDCLELPTKAGLCSACYHRERRWRIAHNLRPNDIEEAA